MEVNGHLQIKGSNDIGGSGSFSGAMVIKNADQAIGNNSTTVVIWQTETYDVGGWFASSGDSRMTVPSGVSYVRVYAQLNMANSATGRREVSILTNGGASSPRPLWRELNPDASVTTTMSFVSPPIPVVAGDYFEVTMFQNSGGDLDCKTGIYSYFAIEAI